MFLGLLSAYVFVRSVVGAAGKAFWYDEFLTLIVAGQGTWRKIMQALVAQTDGQPPAFYMIEHWSSGMAGKPEIALRLPSALGIVVILLCVFAYARRQSGNTIALFVSAALLTTDLYQTYAIEARPYSVVVALVAFAMVCYQRRDSAVWTGLLGISLASAEAFHYLAVLAMIPFGVAELYESYRRRRLRWQVWAALGAGLVPLALFWNLLEGHKKGYGEHHYYSHFGFSSIPVTYAEMLGLGTYWGGAVGLAGIAAVGLILWLGQRGKAGPEPDESSRKRGIQPGEGLFLLCLVTLPFFAYVFTKLTHSGMTSRYILCTLLGLAVAFGYLVAGAGRGTALAAAVFVVSAVGIGELHFWRDEAKNRAAVAEKGTATRQFIESEGYGDLRIVVANPSKLLEVVHYAYPDEARRFVYVERTENEPYLSDTAEKGLLRVRNYVAIQVRPAEEFYQENARFLLYAEGSDTLVTNALRHALSRKRMVRLLADDGLRTLYLVSEAKR